MTFEQDLKKEKRAGAQIATRRRQGPEVGIASCVGAASGSLDYMGTL